MRSLVKTCDDRAGRLDFDMISERYGSFRGLIRLLLSYLQVMSFTAAIQKAGDKKISRLVFVCQGNICRSAYADHAARSLGVNVISFGLSTQAGKQAHPPAIKIAAELGHDLSGHRTSRVEDYAPLPGDLLLAMEVRQLHRLAADPRLRHVPRSLLGLWARPLCPHLHDPFELDDRYMRVCLERIDRAVGNLAKAFPGAQVSRPSI